MKPTLRNLACTAGATILLVVAPAVRVAAAAAGDIALSWGNCAPIVQDATATSGTMSLFVSVLGNDDTHEAYQVRFVLGSADHTVPDAWRFDLGGCQSIAFLGMEHHPIGELSKTCPAFQGNTPSTQIKDFRAVGPEGGVYDPDLMRGTLINIYPAGATSLADRRYFLAEFRFEHLQSVVGDGVPGVTCGGLETPLCINLLTGSPYGSLGTSSYIRVSDGAEIVFEWAPSTWVSVNGLAGCPAVPAARSTWGHIKSVYRR